MISSPPDISPHRPPPVYNLNRNALRSYVSLGLIAVILRNNIFNDSTSTKMLSTNHLNHPRRHRVHQNLLPVFHEQDQNRKAKLQLYRKNITMVNAMVGENNWMLQFSWVLAPISHYLFDVPCYLKNSLIGLQWKVSRNSETFFDDS